MQFRKRRFGRPYFSIIALAVLTALIFADQRGWLLVRQTDDLEAYHGRSASVTRVIDGDTIEINLADELNGRTVTRVRLWGINCPEVARPVAGRPAEALSAEAIALVKGLIANKPVTLWLESHQPRDTFSAILAHVELTDGTRLNEALLEAGLAKVDDRWPHAQLVRYAQIEQASKRRGVGMWSAASRR
jgi:micrococcal nuclease